jgi:NADH-quinone oxidoreductase subunit L
MAASIGLVQNDIKKVFAYSTVSQLGYMFVGIGSGAFSAGIYHVVTHAFFKALLFLGAGSVIHALSGEQDMRHMGGLRKHTKWTFLTMMCAAVAIAGVPPFSGFMSKDAVLLAAHHHTPWIYWVGVVTAGMTAFYVFRAMFMTFFGEYRGHHHPHESPMVMLFPLMVLAVLSLAGGYLFPIPKILEHLFPLAEEAHDATLVAISVAAGLTGIFLAWLMYVAKPSLAASLDGPLHKLLYNKYYVDEIYDFVILKPLLAISRGTLWKGVDTRLIDGTVNGVGGFAQGMGNVLRMLQSGNARSYAVWVLFGSVAVIVALGIAGGLR